MQPHHPAPTVPTARKTRAKVVAAALASSVLLLGACSSDSEGGSGTDRPTTESSSDTSGGGEEQTFEGVLAPAAEAEGAFTYDPAAPSGAELTATVTPGQEETAFELEVAGLEPDRGYAVHAHVDPCGLTGEDAGPHFQNEEDPAATPAAPSSDPEYANGENEVWLDLETDADGAGTGESTVPWAVADRAPMSIVIHQDMATMTAEGMAGMAGDRIACLDAPIQ